MNTPNKLTLLRVILVPVFMLFLLCTGIPGNYLWALVLFVAASITDTIDGKLARKYGLVTDFGKFLDPLADKILVMAALICFVQMGVADAVMVVIILARELMVTSIRLIASAKGKVIAANIWGKVKTVSQMVAIVVTLLFFAIVQLANGVWFFGFFLSQGLLWLSTVLTLVSGVLYLWQNRAFLSAK